jgi:Na+-translocating ferredoxin:NAD+ oxidoreductase RnfD subunit
MLRLIISFIIIIHGLIHLMGFTKAFQYGNITQLTKDISKPLGVLWLLTALLLLISAIFLILQKNSWWMICVPALAFSQLLIFMYWTDAKFGSIANLIILIYVLTFTGIIAKLFE